MASRLLTRLIRRLCASGQCSKCGGWFPDWDGGVCSACQ